MIKLLAGVVIGLGIGVGAAYVYVAYHFRNFLG
jgi:hypothetical protein